MQKTAIIIGAGIAGMSLAQKLSDDGIQVTLIEATNKLGGRTRSIFHKNSGEMIDNGQHLMMGAYRKYIDFLEHIGSAHLLTTIENLDIPFYPVNSPAYRLYDNHIQGKIGFLSAVMAIKELSAIEKLNFSKLAIKMMLLNPDKQKSTAGDFLAENNQSPNLMRLIWNPLILAVLNAPPSLAPASLLIKVMKLAFFASAEASKFMYLNSNYDDLYAPLEAYLNQNGSKILFNTSVREILFSPNRARGVITKNGDFLKADYIISAVPHQQLLKLLPDEIVLNSPLKFLHYFTSNTIISAYFWYKEEIEMPLMSAIIDSPIHWIFNRRKMMANNDNINNENIKNGNLDYKSCFAITISDAGNHNAKSNQEIAEMISEELAKINEQFSKFKAAEYLIIKDKQATFSTSIQSEKVRISQKTQFANFFIAGDWTDTKYPATIEGAAVSADLIHKNIVEG